MGSHASHRSQRVLFPSRRAGRPWRASPPTAGPRQAMRSPVRLAGDHVFCADRTGAVHRTSRDGAGDCLVASSRTGSRIAAAALGGSHTALGYLASRQTSEGWVSEAWLAVDDEAPVRLSEDGERRDVARPRPAERLGARLDRRRARRAHRASRARRDVRGRTRSWARTRWSSSAAPAIAAPRAPSRVPPAASGLGLAAHREGHRLVRHGHRARGRSRAHRRARRVVDVPERARPRAGGRRHREWQDVGGAGATAGRASRDRRACSSWGSYHRKGRSCARTSCASAAKHDGRGARRRPARGALGLGWVEWLRELAPAPCGRDERSG